MNAIASGSLRHARQALLVTVLGALGVTALVNGRLSARCARSVTAAEPPPVALTLTLTTAASDPPHLLSETGLYVAGSTSQIAPENRPYSPQYALWSDGADKRRWVYLPSGQTIDAAEPEAWVFPIGTRFWKEFSFGERVETRYIERVSDGSYRYATYVWDAAQRDAVLAPTDGQLGVHEIAPGVRHDIPSVSDCRACHEGRSRSPILGFDALQLSSERDPNALHAQPLVAGALGLNELWQRGVLVNLPRELAAHAPRIDAPSPTARAAAGYLFGNCAHCHNGSGPLANVGLDFDQPLTSTGYSELWRRVANRASHYRLPGEERSLRVSPKHPEQSALWFRMQSRFPAAQMPPLATKLVDTEAIALIARWINSDPRTTERTSP